MADRISNPELKKYMDRRVMIDIQAGRRISGVLRGYDIFLNLVVDEAFEELGAGERRACGQVVVRGNSVGPIELVDSAKVWQERGPPMGAPGGFQGRPRME